MGKVQRPLPSWIGRPEAASPLDRMPGLRDRLERIASRWADLFVAFSGTAAQASAAAPQSLAWEQLAARYDSGAILAVIDAPAWNAELILSLTTETIALAADALFGGDGEAVAAPETATGLSAVARGIAESLTRQMAEALTDCNADRPGGFAFDRILSKPDFGCLGKAGTQVVVAGLTARLLGRDLALQLLIPLDALELLAADLAQSASVAAPSVDPVWARQLESEVGRALARLSARIDLPDMSLGAVARLAPGQVLPLPGGGNTKVRLLCREDELFRCDLGQAGGHYTLRIEKTLPGQGSSAPFAPSQRMAEAAGTP